MGKKEKILELIMENDGLTYNKIIDKYNEKYDNPTEPDTIKRKSGYVYLKRLKDDDLIENEKGINVLYKPTQKALTDNPDKVDSKYQKIVIRLLDGKNISEEEYAYITRDNWKKKKRYWKKANFKAKKKNINNRKGIKKVKIDSNSSFVGMRNISHTPTTNVTKDNTIDICPMCNKRTKKNLDSIQENGMNKDEIIQWFSTFINRNKDNFTLDWLRGQKLTFESIYEMRK